MTFRYCLSFLQELKSYVAASTRTALNVNKLDWWARHEAQLPFLNSGSNAVMLFQLSSAASEWAFSLLSNILQDTQHSSLEDYICTSIILTTCVCRLVSIIISSLIKENI